MGSSVYLTRRRAQRQLQHTLEHAAPHQPPRCGDVSGQVGVVRVHERVQLVERAVEPRLAAVEAREVLHALGELVLEAKTQLVRHEQVVERGYLAEGREVAEIAV